METYKYLQNNSFASYRYLFGLEKPTNWWEIEFYKFLQETYYQYLRRERPINCIEAPVQHGKSTKLRYFLAWLIGRHPNKRFNFYSADESLRDETTEHVKTILQDERYIDVWGSRFEDGTREKIKICGGGMAQFRITGGGNIGYPSHFSIVDDPYSKKESAYSAVERKKVLGQFKADIISRRQNDSMTLITHSRWVPEDLIGTIKQEQTQYESPVKFFSYPAIATEKEKHRDIGQALFPEFRNEQFLKEQKSIMQPAEWMALYQQNPIIEGGNLFKLDWFALVHGSDLPKEFDYRFVVGDTSYKDKQQNDFTVFSYWGVKHKKLYLIDMIRKQIESIDVERWVEPWLITKVSRGFRGFWCEPAGHGHYLNQAFKRKGVPIPEEKLLNDIMHRKTDKVMRANNAIAWIDKINYNVLLNKDIACFDDFKEELVGFPTAKHDDTCFVAGTKVSTLFGYKKIKDVKKDDYVITPFGLSKVLEAGCTGLKEVITNIGITGTPTHKIFTLDNLQDLNIINPNDIIKISFRRFLKWRYQKFLSLTAGHTDLWGREDINNERRA
jgi:predicted phage terminase large subunit-like protein